MNVDTCFEQVGQNLIDLMKRILTDLASVRLQTTTWIRFNQALKDVAGNVLGYYRVVLPLNSTTMEIFQGSGFNEIVKKMFTHMNPALRNSKFLFNEVLFLHVNFYWLNLTRGSSYIPLAD